MAYDAREIDISVVKRVAKNTKHQVVVCDNTDYIVNFTFDSEWNNFPSKKAVFVYGDNYSQKIINEVLIDESITNADGTVTYRCLMPKMTGVDSCLIGVQSLKAVGAASSYSAYNESSTYNFGDLISRSETVGTITSVKIYQCNSETAVTGAWNASLWIDVTSYANSDIIRTTTSAYITCIASILDDTSGLQPDSFKRFNAAYINSIGHLIIEQIQDDGSVRIFDAGGVAPKIISSQIVYSDNTAQGWSEGDLILEFGYDISSELIYNINSTNHIAINIDKSIFETMVGKLPGTYTFSNTSSGWVLNGGNIVTISQYGITIVGTVNVGDIIVIKYQQDYWHNS